MLLALTAVPPPKALKFTVTVEIVSELLSPLLVLLQVANTVSPILKAPLVPLAPLIVIFASVTVGATLSTVTLVESEVVVAFPALSVAVIDTFRLAPSTDPATIS
ncbi:MAG: hypothetical protein FD165_2923 [Gammaproteobacteria bacterium]|nr:MAG: hypothetical protein FD165_2923 [Gammaproteobacteria bacterium]